MPCNILLSADALQDLYPRSGQACLYDFSTALERVPSFSIRDLDRKLTRLRSLAAGILWLELRGGERQQSTRAERSIAVGFPEWDARASMAERADRESPTHVFASTICHLQSSMDDSYRPFRSRSQDSSCPPALQHHGDPKSFQVK